MTAPDSLRYTKTHEWIRLDGDVATLGITDYAQNELGDVVFVDLPSIGRDLRRNGVFGSIESVKAVSDLVSPVSGVVLEINEAVTIKPELVNDSPYDDGWLLKIRLTRPDEVTKLMSAVDYAAFAAGE